MAKVTSKSYATAHGWDSVVKMDVTGSAWQSGVAFVVERVKQAVGESSSVGSKSPFVVYRLNDIQKGLRARPNRAAWGWPSVWQIEHCSKTVLIEEMVKTSRTHPSIDSVPTTQTGMTLWRQAASLPIVCSCRSHDRVQQIEPFGRKDDASI